MKAAVRYYTKSGNSKKLADAIASAIGVEARTVNSPLDEDVDVLFLCNSVYWGGVDKAVKDFLKNPGAKIDTLVNVSTAALVESSYKQIKKIVNENSIRVDSREFHCKGSFKGMHKGKPDDEDIRKVKKFARKIVG